jgi:hypothetical protein
MRHLALALLALCILPPAPAGAQATLNKCIDARGAVTYSNLPCKNAREARRIEVDPAPPKTTTSAKPGAAAPAPGVDAASADLRLDTQRNSGKPASRGTSRQCDSLSDRIGRLLDKMDQARRTGYSQEQMNTWNEEVRELERKKQQSGCF